MKYVVELKQVISKKVVVDAMDDKEADEKLMRNDVEYEFENVTSTDTYNGYEYVDCKRYSGKEDERLICKLGDLAEYLGIAEYEIGRYLYKYTDCGMAFDSDKNGITLVGYVECDCDDVSPSETLSYPFTVKDFEDTVKNLELEADILWHELNGDGEDDTWE